MKRLLTLLLLSPRGEIQMREFAIKLLRFLVIGAGRLFGRNERTDENGSPLVRNTSIPFSIALMPIYTLKAARVVVTNTCITLILGMTGLAKILLSIVESVVIFMIYFLRWITVKNYLMHKYIACRSGIKFIRSLIPASMPVSLIQPFKIFSIHDCILALCQSNKTVGWVKRLDNRMAFHSAFHRSSMKGLLNFSRYAIIFVVALLSESIALSQGLPPNPTSGGPIPSTTYTTPSTIGGGGGGISYGLGSGTAQAQIIASPSPTIGALTNGVQVCWLPVAANTAAAPTLQVGTLAAKPITKYGTVALVANDITTVAIACAVYDGTEFQLQVPLAGGVFTGSISTGSGASACGAGTTACFAGVEAATACTPTAGQICKRFDSVTNNSVTSANGAAEVPDLLLTAVPVGTRCLHTSGTSGGVAETAGDCASAPNFPVTVGGTVTSGGIPYFNSTVQESSSALLAANALVVGGGAGAAPATGSADFTYASHTLTGGAAGIVDLSAETGANSFLVPFSASDPSTNGALRLNSGFGSLAVFTGNVNYLAVAGRGTNTISTSCTNQVFITISSTSGPTCTSITNAFLPASITATAQLSGATYATATNCSSSASPAVCGSAAAGSVAVPTGVTPTLVVNTTAVTANSQILFTPDESLGTKLSVTCNSTIAQVAIEPIVTARTAATSFTIQYNTTITVNPICLSYLIVN